MKHIKLFETFSEKKPQYKKPEYEFKEFYRVFKNHNKLRPMLPSNIDQKIFDVMGGGFDNEPKWIENHFDPPNRSGEIGTDELIEIAKGEDPRFVPFIIWCRDLFERGKMEKIGLDWIRPRLTTKFKNHDWSVLQDAPDYLDSCKTEYKKAIAAGIGSDAITKTLGLVQKYPNIKISQAQFWSYIKGSIAHFDKVEKSGGQLPCTQFILYKGNYYTVGGRRRMFWHFYNDVDPTVWMM